MSSVFMVAGESSGDLHGAAVVKALLKRDPTLTITGIGGPKMAEAGVKLTVDVTSHAAVGIIEALNSIRYIYGIFRETVRLLEATKPDVLLLIDYPEFNLRLARAAKKLGIKVVYYVSPQVWAWRRYRVRIIEKYVDKMLVIFPFEEEFYRKHGVEVEFVGHPLVNELKTVPDRQVSREALGIDESRKVIALLPGSRRKEVEAIMPALGAAAKIIQEKIHQPLTFICAKAPAIDKATIERHIGEQGIDFRIITDDTYRVVRAADLAVVASGTATVETMLLGTPMIVVYKMAAVSYIFRPVILRVPYISMVNIIAGEEAVPELVQWHATPENIAQHAVELFEPEKMQRMSQRLAEIAAKFDPAKKDGTLNDNLDVPQLVADRVLGYGGKKV